MSDSEFPTPELNVLLIASHVVYGYVGNKTASFVMQALGCNVSALNTVHFSNHTGYGQWRGGKLSGDEMRDVWAGLRKNELVSDFDLMLTGYCPGPDAVEAAGSMARELKTAAITRPGSFFWILDPVMGDNGRLYVDPAVVPVYRSLVDHADLIVPNQFELETLAGTDPSPSSSSSSSSSSSGTPSLDSPAALLAAIESVHSGHRTPHVLVTSVKFAHAAQGSMSVVGSSRTSDGRARAFRIDVPVFDCFFSGSGDLLASLLAVRLREAAAAAGLLGVQSWLSPDHVAAVNLPLARAAEKVLASMHAVLQKTMDERDRLLAAAGEGGGGGPQGSAVAAEEGDRKAHLATTKAAEIRIVRNVKDLLYPPEGLFTAEPLDTSALSGAGKE